MTNLDDLPFSIFSLVQEYFLEYSCDHAYQNEFLQNNRRIWKQFVRCSKSGIIPEVKRKYSYYPLNRQYSYAYVIYNEGIPLEEQSNDANAICTLLQRIENPSKQVSLNFSYYDPNKEKEVEKQDEIDELVSKVTPSFVTEYADRFKTIHGISLRWHEELSENLDLSYFSSLYFVDLSFSEFSPSEIACLRNVKKLDCAFCPLVMELPDKSENRTDYSLPLLSTVEEANFSCTEICDISLLQNLKKVILCACYHFDNVSPLKNVYHVDLSECEYIYDISALKNVYRLFLNGCLDISDISPLTGVCYLSIKGSSNITKFLPVEKPIALKELTFSSNHLPFVKEFQKPLISLHIFGTFPAFPISAMNHFERMHLYSENTLTEISDLPKLRYLTCSNCRKVEVIKNLPNLVNLGIYGQSKYTNYQDYYLLKELDLSSSSLLTVARVSFYSVKELIFKAPFQPIHKVEVRFYLCAESLHVYNAVDVLENHYFPTIPSSSLHLYNHINSLSIYEDATKVIYHNG
jgi:hypothetical protein